MSFLYYILLSGEHDKCIYTSCMVYMTETVYESVCLCVPAHVRVRVQYREVSSLNSSGVKCT